MSTKPAPCQGCGFHYNCLCEHTPSLTSELRIELLMHETEAQRTSNTGRLLEAALPHCRRHIWQRKTPPSELLTLLADPAVQPFLVFPSDTAQPLDKVVSRQSSASYAKPLHFIIVDATWQQARKMLRQSPWLEDVPTVTLPEGLTTRYSLRRNQPSGSLCTCEVGIELMAALGEKKNASIMSTYLEQFMRIFESDRQHIAVTP
ncbi:DTW domain-containing protein [Enterovibrio makurazakiensis]|uniref:tRNA-uridine aminocarboxypropyltransferase n=1 Tax=Enterovibrio gelatinilyticus TaxID=2899819 RepID=A0ABT5QZZ5_9GAMM|nr:DTW domain-containing protein [Enterovibrio sp. ZSDZ42]MDD1793485.1 DTW domain-containing protein [Enterovibrio sp. ZSDZ42]